MNDVRGLLVDFDGTLVDTAAANYMAYATALAEQEITITRASFDQIAAGRNWRQFLPDLLSAHDCRMDPADVARRKTVIYPRFFDLIVVNRALIGLLALCRPHVQVALVTTASRTNVLAILEHFDLAASFDLMVVGEDVACHKPAPDAYHLAAERLALSSEHCVVIEDSEIGVAAGLAFGAHVLRVGF
jgi:beta-phosphoglucomutase